MSQQNPSISITLDKTALANKICPLCGSLLGKYALLQMLKLWPSQEPDNFDIDVAGGWLFLRYTGSGFPAVEVDRIRVNDLQVNQQDGFIAVIWLGQLSNFYLAFTEITKAQYSTYTGIDLNPDGSINFVSQPDNISEQIAPSGSVQAGDVLLIGITFSRTASALQVGVGISKWDFGQDAPVSIVSKTYNTNQNYPCKTAYILEPKGTNAYYAIAMARRENRAPPDVFMKLARKLGLANPNDVKPW